jgi:adenylate cyclase
VRAAVLLADLRGFTALAGRADPADVVGWLNEHFDAMGDPVLERGGKILKFLGDGLLAVFPVAGSGAEIEGAACTLALAAAEDALARNAALNAGRAATGGPTLGLDVALHFGEVVYGNTGTARRLDFTVIGRVVNEASRMERLCDALGRHLLLSADFAQRCGVDAGRGCSLESLDRHVLAGVGERELFAPAAASAAGEPRDSCLG